MTTHPPIKDPDDPQPGWRFSHFREAGWILTAVDQIQPLSGQGARLCMSKNGGFYIVPLLDNQTLQTWLTT